jgi:TatA/E family protein of Tat protein translocase
LFGSKKIPDLFRAVGSSIKNFKSGISEEEKKDEESKV